MRARSSDQSPGQSRPQDKPQASFSVTEWGRLGNEQEGKEDASRARKDVLLHHHSHSHIPATDQKEWKINDFQQNGAQECLIHL